MKKIKANPKTAKEVVFYHKKYDVENLDQNLKNKKNYPKR